MKLCARMSRNASTRWSGNCRRAAHEGGRRRSSPASWSGFGNAGIPMLFHPSHDDPFPCTQSTGSERARRISRIRGFRGPEATARLGNASPSSSAIYSIREQAGADCLSVCDIFSPGSCRAPGTLQARRQFTPLAVDNADHCDRGVYAVHSANVRRPAGGSGRLPHL